MPVASKNKDLAYRQVLGMRMIHGIEGEYTIAEALRSVQRCWAIEHPSEAHDGILPDEICQDILLAEDKDVVKQQLQSARVAKEFKSTSVTIFTQGLGAYKWKPSGTTGSGKASKRVARPTCKSADVSDMEAFLWKHAPDNARVGVCCDESNGRFQLSYRGVTYSRKSVSWDKRGHELCVRDCLDWLWDTHYSHTRERPEWHSD
eukprot:6466505-Amphidinium_carterae.2